MGNVFYCGERDDEGMHWKQQLQTTCSDMKNQMCWAEPILIQLKDLRTSNKYQKQLHGWAQSYSDSSISEGIRTLRSEASNRQMKNIETIVRRTGFAEEDLIEHYVKPNRASFNFSVQSITPSYIYHEKTSNVGMANSQVEFEDQLSFFVQITSQIKQHFEQPNELGIMIIKFRESLQQIQKKSTFAELHQQLTLFCRTLYETAVIYYDMIALKKKYSSYTVLLNEETLLNFIVNYVMQNEAIYKLIFNSLQQEFNAIQKQTEQIFKQLQNITIQELQVPEDFQLKSKEEPYKKPIQTLKKIVKKLGPSSKVKLIINCSQQIQAGVREENSNRGGSILMQADDLLPIMKYILIKSQIYDIDLQLNYIEKLITNGMLNSSSGYYVITMKAALSSLRDHNQQQNFKQQKQ